MELGQTAILRSIEILQNMGCDMRVLQMEGAKDPDEYVIKYGNVRFQNLMECLELKKLVRCLGSGLGR